jgi:formylglycine-generating enzyme
MGFLLRRLGLVSLVAVLWVSGSAGWCVAKKVGNTSPVAGTKSGAVKINPKDGAEMVWVPSGQFTMGSTEEEMSSLIVRYGIPKEMAWVYEANCPQRKVDLDGYWMYKTEVTVAQYRKFCEATGRTMPDAPRLGWKDDRPVVNVTWEDADAYAKWAGCALPTEAQWEKAARGTDARKYPWGDKLDPSRCVSSVDRNADGAEAVGSHPAGASPYGCQDMAGNVWEWCADWYDPSYYKNAPSKSPRGPSAEVKLPGSASTAHVIRGGSWYNNLNDQLECASRYYRFSPKYRYSYDGFRCAKSP